MQQTKGKVIVNMGWRFAERTAAQGIQLIVSIILARLLMPEDYGTIALLTVFISIANAFVDSGFGGALIQKLDADDVDFSSVFYFNVIMGLLIYAMLYIVSPYIAIFYNDPKITKVFRVMALTIIIGCVKSVQYSYIYKRLELKKFFMSTSVGTVISAFIGIYMAYNGFGVWALVAQNMTNSAIDMTMMWVMSGWHPKLVFSFKRVRSMFSYGSRMLTAGLLDTLYNNMYSLIIGKFYSKFDLGLYNKGKSYPMLFVENINSSIQSVLFPVMAENQKDIETVKQITKKSIMLSTFVIFGLMAGLAAVARPMTILLLTEKWSGSVIYLQLCCFIYAFWPINTANLAAIQAIGRSDVFLRLEIFKKILGICMVIATVPFGVKIMVIGRCATTMISTFINLFPNKKLLGYSYTEQLKNILPSILMAAFMGMCVYSIQFIGLSDIVTIAIQIPLGVLIYIVGSYILKFEAFNYILDMLKPMYKKFKI